MKNLKVHGSIQAGTERPCVVVTGPGETQVGGVTTFIQILMSSRIVSEKYNLIHLDTSRAPEDFSTAGRLSVTNLSYLLDQIRQLILIAIRQKPVLMHIAVTSGWAFWKGGAFLFIGKAFGMKIVSHVHSGAMRDYYRKSPYLVRRLIGWLLKRADIVIALSEQWRQFLLDEVRPDLRVVVLPNSVDPAFASAVEKEDYLDRQSGNAILFVGMLAEAKGVFDILHAASKVLAKRSDAIFLFVGGAHDDRIPDEMKRYCADAGLGNAVQFLGEVTGEAKLDIFRKAALFVLPSYWEGLPYALLEAMAVGLPVVTTPVGAIPEIVKDGQQGFLIQPGDDTALAERIFQLLDDRSLGQRMGMANQRLIRDTYLPDRAMNHLLNLYDELRGVLGSEIQQPAMVDSTGKFPP